MSRSNGNRLVTTGTAVKNRSPASMADQTVLARTTCLKSLCPPAVSRNRTVILRAALELATALLKVRVVCEKESADELSADLQIVVVSRRRDLGRSAALLSFRRVTVQQAPDVFVKSPLCMCGGSVGASSTHPSICRSHGKRPLVAVALSVNVEMRRLDLRHLDLAVRPKDQGARTTTSALAASLRGSIRPRLMSSRNALAHRQTEEVGRPIPHASGNPGTRHWMLFHGDQIVGLRLSPIPAIREPSATCAA